jgi:hypothetical protein
MNVNKRPACAACRADAEHAQEEVQRCLYDCTDRTERAMAQLRIDYPDMPDSELYRLDAHNWLEANFTFDEQCALQAEIDDADVKQASAWDAIQRLDKGDNQ